MREISSFFRFSLIQTIVITLLFHPPYGYTLFASEKVELTTLTWNDFYNLPEKQRKSFLKKWSNNRPGKLRKFSPQKVFLPLVRSTFYANLAAKLPEIGSQEMTYKEFDKIAGITIRNKLFLQPATLGTYLISYIALGIILYNLMGLTRDLGGMYLPAGINKYLISSGSSTINALFIMLTGSLLGPLMNRIYPRIAQFLFKNSDANISTELDSSLGPVRKTLNRYWSSMQGRYDTNSQIVTNILLQSIARLNTELSRLNSGAGIVSDFFINPYVLKERDINPETHSLLSAKELQAGKKALAFQVAPILFILRYYNAHIPSNQEAMIAEARAHFIQLHKITKRDLKLPHGKSIFDSDFIEMTLYFLKNDLENSPDILNGQSSESHWKNLKPFYIDIMQSWFSFPKDPAEEVIVIHSKYLEV